jgi:hypothetical protein
MKLITDISELPILPPEWMEGTLYKGHLPVILFTVKEHREYEREHSRWAGWVQARETAREHFKAHGECQCIELLFLNPPGMDRNFAYGGAYKREDFDQ